MLVSIPLYRWRHYLLASFIFLPTPPMNDICTVTKIVSLFQSLPMHNRETRFAKRNAKSKSSQVVIVIYNEKNFRYIELVKRIDFTLSPRIYVRFEPPFVFTAVEIRVQTRLAIGIEFRALCPIQTNEWPGWNPSAPAKRQNSPYVMFLDSSHEIVIFFNNFQLFLTISD